MEQVRASQVRYLERISEISKVLEQNLEMEQVLQMAVDKVMELFKADRALLISPVDPADSELVIRYLQEKDEFRTGLTDRPLMRDEFQDAMARLLMGSTDPVTVSPQDGFPGFDEMTSEYGIQSLAAVAIRPKNGKPWALSLNQCSYERTWNQDDLRLLKDISQRLTVVMDNLLLHRDLQASEGRFRWLVENTTEIVWRFDLRNPIPIDMPEADQLQAWRGCTAMSGPRISWAPPLSVCWIRTRPRTCNTSGISSAPATVTWTRNP
jgi:transcriptional regulator with GAF, ATPase, and Fis domain